MAQIDGKTLASLRLLRLGKNGLAGPSFGGGRAVRLHSRLGFSGLGDVAYDLLVETAWIRPQIKVGFSWFLDFLLPAEFVQLRLGSPDAISKAHFEPGEVVFRQGDLGDSLYIILAGDAEVFVQRDGQEQVISRMAAGEYFGEMALLGHTTRGATVRSLTAMDVLVVRAAAFETLVATLPDMRKSFEHVMRERVERDAQRASSAGPVEGDE